MGSSRHILVLAMLAFIGSLVLGTATPQAAGPIGYWKLDETASPADDAIATANGTWNGGVAATTDVPGPITTAGAIADCGSLRFFPVATAGATNYVSLGRSAALDAVQNGSFTLSAWFKANSIPTAGSDGQYGIVLKTGLHEGLSLAGNSFVMGHWMGTAPDYYAAGYGAGSVSVGVWYHVAGTVDMTAHEVRVYINGVAPPFNNVTPFPAGVTAWAGYANEPWLIGINDPAGGGARYQADGVVDDVRIYDRVLTGTEITTLANGGIVGDPPVPLPAAPTGLTATGGVGQITLSWTPVAGANGYNVKRSNISGAETQLAVAPASPYVDTTATPGVTFFYVVSTLSGCTEGANSTEASAVATSPIPPPPRTATVGENKHHRCGCSSTSPSASGLLLAGALAFLLLLACRR